MIFRDQQQRPVCQFTSSYPIQYPTWLSNSSNDLDPLPSVIALSHLFGVRHVQLHQWPLSSRSSVCQVCACSPIINKFCMHCSYSCWSTASSIWESIHVYDSEVQYRILPQLHFPCQWDETSWSSPDFSQDMTQMFGVSLSLHQPDAFAGVHIEVLLVDESLIG